ncbi:MAG: hypothetical protein IBJ19_17360 [Gemmatimonadaceae bacterium]|nr:hypothetical protein [Gemmatimonadaceae bacterium]
MLVHRQTNRRRVSDAFVRAMLRERVRNQLPIDAKTVRALGIACGSDRLSRLRRQVLGQLEREFTTEAATDRPMVGTGAPFAATGEGWRSRDTATSHSADLQRAPGATPAHPERTSFRFEVAAICGPLVRRLMTVLLRFSVRAKSPVAN